MTKEQFLAKWEWHSKILIADFEAVIEHEIAKAKEAQPKPEYICYKCENKTNNKFAICDKCNLGWNEPKQETLEPSINPIEQAYERGEKIRHKAWLNGDWIQKHKETKSIDNYGSINSVYPFAFIQHPEKWELYTEPEQVTEPTEQPVMTEKEKIDHILTNKLTWKPMGNKRFYANMIGGKASDGSRQVYFVDYNNPFSGYFETRIFKIDLAEWQPVETEQPSSQAKLDNSFDKDRFEAMFRAVIETHEATMNALKQLDAYYASKNN